MTVQELIELLQKFDEPLAEVKTINNDGDYDEPLVVAVTRGDTIACIMISALNDD